MGVCMSTLMKAALLLVGGAAKCCLTSTLRCDGCRYFNDVWSFCLEDFKWTPLGPKPGHAAPAPRGGCQLALYGDSLFIFGGYSVQVQHDKGECTP